MKKLISILFFINCFFSLSAQSRAKIDSLLQLLENEKREDTNRVKRYIQLASNYSTLKPDSTICYADTALMLSEKLDYPRGKVFAYRNLSSGFKLMGDFPLAIEFLQKARDIISKTKNAGNPEDLDLTTANLNFIQGEYRKTLDFYLQKLSEGKYRTDHDLLVAHSFIAASYANMRMPDSALFHVKIAYPHALKTGEEISWTYFIFGEAYFQLNQLDAAMENYKLAYLNLQKGGDAYDLINAALGLAKVYKAKGNTDSCIWFAQWALAESQAGSFRERAILASTLLGETYEKINPVESIRYYKMAFAINDSVFGQQKIRQAQNLKYKEELRKRDLEEKDRQNKARLWVYLLVGGLSALLIITLILIRNNRQKQKARKKIQDAYDQLKATQQQLIQSEKMASLGELTAGIAHEIQNPLNFVNNFSELNKELLVEMNEEINKGNLEDVKAIAKDVIDNEEKINHHGKRAESIVKGMLQHSRNSSGQKEPTDINALADECLRLSYHGLRAKDKSFNARTETDFDSTIPKINISPQDIGRVILNLFTNAFYAVMQKKKQLGAAYEPVVTVKTSLVPLSGGRGTGISIAIRDNGNGVPQKIMDKIFQPFFTTKPVGEGTGLGLSMSYEIITKGHGGELKVQTREGEFAEFIINLPA